MVGEPAVETVLVTRGETVIVIWGVTAEEVTDGVRIACKVNAAAV
jgi:hypothetical protein